MSNNRFADTLAKLNGMRPWEVPLNPDVHAHIVALYNQVHGDGGEAFAERESRFLNCMIRDDKNKWNVTPLSVFLAYVDLAVKNLTLEPGSQALCYLLNRSSKIHASDGKGGIAEVWENRCYLAVTGYGEIVLRQRAGQIRHCDTPTVVYYGDSFTYTEIDGRKKVAYTLDIEHDPSHPVACFMKITRADGSVDYAIILPEAWKRLEGYSLKQNERTVRDKSKAAPNALYRSGQGGSIDPGFLIAKCVKHAFKAYPKLPIGKGMVMEADLPAEDETPDYYTMDGDTPRQKEPDSFAKPADMSGGVTVDPSADEASDDGTW